ncbi:hypothetical protein APSETT444_000974 [Aspergillus pseudonomiae]
MLIQATTIDKSCRCHVLTGQGCVDLSNDRVVPLTQLAPEVSETSHDKRDTVAAPEAIIDDHGPRPLKRRKTVSGLRLAPHNQDAAIAGAESQIDGYTAPDSNGMTDDAQKSSVRQVFRAVNTLCLKYYNQSQSSRALEMIVQAYWIECYEARIAVLRLENPNLSAMEIRMMGLREACAVLNWKEKDLRNRIAIWRGYKEIKDAGGWASLIFASAGVYRFCKYRTGFGEGFSTRLRHIRSSLEVAADTLHPDWRDLLQVIGQQETRQYHGHPHEWVTVTGRPAVPLISTYEHLQLPNGFHYRFIDECVLDTAAFGTEDPRRVPEIDSDNFDRGIAIGEFTGLITKGIEGVDVMLGGSRTRTYQIFQGQMGNFTRQPLNKPAAEMHAAGGVEESAPVTATRKGTFVKSITINRRIPVRTNPKASLDRWTDTIRPHGKLSPSFYDGYIRVAQIYNVWTSTGTSFVGHISLN